MFRSLLSRLRLSADPSQLGLAFDREAQLLARLRHLGLHRIDRLTLTRNRSVFVSFAGAVLRVHEVFADAPDDVLRAIVVFVCGRGAARRAARRQILEYPVPVGERARRKPTATHRDDRLAADRLAEEHARLNHERFGGALRKIHVAVSRRMRTRLGHYAPAASHGVAEIAISRRHIRRHGWDEVLDTLLHEMVHQWQEESGLPVNHGASFRRKATEVGAVPRAKKRPPATLAR
jgi:hypothetical protein